MNGPNPSQTFSSSLHSMSKIAKESSLYIDQALGIQNSSVLQKHTHGQFRNSNREETTWED